MTQKGSENALPNIVFICSDHHRWDYIGSFGNEYVITPNLNAFAAKGTTITGAYCNSPLCVPSRIAMTSGRYAMNSGCFSNRHAVAPSIPTYIKKLRDNGINTAKHISGTIQINILYSIYTGYNRSFIYIFSKR